MKQPMSFEQIAAVEHISVSEARTAYYYALIKLRRHRGAVTRLRALATLLEVERGHER